MNIETYPTRPFEVEPNYPYEVEPIRPLEIDREPLECPGREKEDPYPYICPGYPDDRNNPNHPSEVWC